MQSTPASSRTGTILDEIVAHKCTELAARKELTPLTTVQSQAKPCTTSFTTALAGTGINLIAEIKPKSPSAGSLTADFNTDRIIEIYNKHAAAISVLADQRYFGGSIDLLRDVSAKSRCPVLCKEFVIDPYQVFEARAAGASAVLLIVKILSDELLANLKELIESLGMTAVIEVQSENETERALPINPSVILVNNRDLTTFVIDLNTTAALAKLLPASAILVAASGIETRKDIEQLLPYTRNFLIGSSLMRSANPEQLMKELCANP
jgi:indole-3-glycerol phosphate synthase / phosphoribosylanthranilate isomerase